MKLNQRAKSWTRKYAVTVLRKYTSRSICLYRYCRSCTAEAFAVIGNT